MIPVEGTTKWKVQRRKFCLWCTVVRTFDAGFHSIDLDLTFEEDEAKQFIGQQLLKAKKAVETNKRKPIYFSS